ncbi:MAG: type II toxin-antitoxin system PemK/MazF family toxin [Candidatus Obscuribacterales bacterium]|nr:type II toxin-antitoxin system PemK/MazF family toxin [Candidatus Obscuribacterales bacterium]
MVRLGNPVPTRTGDTLREQADDRPAVVISSDTILLPNLRFHRMLTVVPGTTTDRNLPIHLTVGSSKANGLPKNTYFMVEQIRSIDERRVIKPIGSLDPVDLQQLNQLIRWCFDL